MRKTSVIRLAAAAVLCGGAWVAYTQQAPAPAKLTTQKIKDDLYMIHNEIVPGNTTALVTNDGVLLVDDKFAVDHDNILAEVKKITDKPVKYVIDTHHHGDHSGGNAAMQKMNVQVIASEKARENMVDGKQPGLPDIVFENHAHVFLGGKNVEMFYFGRAHTNGDIVVYFPQDRVLSAGDMFTQGDATPQLIDYAGGGSAKEWTLTLDKAMRLDFDTVVPGHGNLSTRADMKKFRDDTLAVRNTVHDMIQQKKTKEEISKMLADRYHWGPLQMNLSVDGMLAELR